MKFDPVFFIRLAQRNGVKLTRISNGKSNYIKVQKTTAIWNDVIRQNKRQLLKYLPDEEIKRIQTDLFEDL